MPEQNRDEILYYKTSESIFRDLNKEIPVIDILSPLPVCLIRSQRILRSAILPYSVDSWVHLSWKTN